jgi:integrase
MPLHTLDQKNLEKKLKAAKAAGKVVKIADGSNLYLVVRPAGAPSWQLNYHFDGKRKPYSIGTYPLVSLSQARVLAQAAREMVQSGKDPVAERRSVRKATEGQITVTELVNNWLTKNKPGWSDTHYDDMVKAYEHDIAPHLGSSVASAVTPDEIRAVLERIEKRGALYQLTRSRSVIMRAFEDAVDRGLLSSNPVARVKRSTFDAHQGGHHPSRTLYHEFAKIIKDMDEERSTLPVIALRLNALVWVRLQNLRNATWSQFDLDNAVWQVPFKLMKMEREFLVPLAKQTVELLKNLKTLTGGEDLLFPGNDKRPMSENTLNKNLQRMGYKGLHSVHGLSLIHI